MSIEGFSVLIGLVMPAVVEFIKVRFADSKRVNFAIAFITSLIVGTLTTLLTEGFSVSELLGSIGAVFTASQVVYNLYWKGSKLEARLLESVAKKSSKKK